MRDNLSVEDTSEDVVNNLKHYKLYSHECIDEMILVFGIEDVKAFVGAIYGNTDIMHQLKMVKKI